MIYRVRIGRRSNSSLYPDLIILVESEEMLTAVLSCSDLENTKYAIKNVAEISEDDTIGSLLRSNDHDGQ